MAVKVVVFGGSGVATPELARAIHQTPGRTQPIELVLVGRSKEKLEKVVGVSRILAEKDPLLTITAINEIEAALSEADYILNQIRVGGLEARAFDESFPNNLGIPGEETVGAGGFANASRTIPVVLDYARLVEKICPSALMLSFANPSSMVQYAVLRYTQVNAIGLCDAPINLIQNIAKALSLSPGQLVVDYVGMHHFGWVSGVWHQGVDIMPRVLEKIAEVNPNIEPELVRALGVIPGNYLNYIFHADRMLAKKIGKRTRAEELLALQNELMAEYERCLATGQEPDGLEKRKAHWYQAIIAPVLLTLIEGHAGKSRYFRQKRFILDLVNQGLIAWLPGGAIVELPANIEDGFIHPFAPARLPVDIQVLVQRNCAYEMLAVEAIVERNHGKALRALLLNPMIHTYDQAAAVLDRAWSKPG